MERNASLESRAEKERVSKPGEPAAASEPGTPRTGIQAAAACLGSRRSLERSGGNQYSLCVRLPGPETSAGFFAFLVGLGPLDFSLSSSGARRKQLGGPGMQRRLPPSSPVIRHGVASQRLASWISGPVRQATLQADGRGLPLLGCHPLILPKSGSKGGCSLWVLSVNTRPQISLSKL